MNKHVRINGMGMVVGAAVAATVLAGLPARAASPGLGLAGQWSVASGKVTVVDPAAMTLKIQTGLLQKTFTVDKTTEISDGRRILQLQDLRPGTEVRIEYSEQDGKLLSRSITIGGSQSSKSEPLSVPASSAPVQQSNPAQPSAP